MKILFVIDHFGPGGAQRQMVSLALGLVERGHEVEFFNYHPEYKFFRHELEETEITIHDYPKSKKGFSLNVLLALKKLLAFKNFDVSLAFLDSPSIYLLFAGIGSRSKLIVSDRSSHMRFNKYSYTIKRQLFHLADAVVANSWTQANWLVREAKLYRKKVYTIYNGYDPDRFGFFPNLLEDKKNLKLIGIGRINPVKNFENLIKALEIFHAAHGWCPALTWVGRSDSPEYEERIYQLLEKTPHVKNAWTWAGQRNNITELLAHHHALILPSLYEGLPNVVCEAMIAGKPVLVSNVCDNPLLVKDGERGFLFDPNYPQEIVQKIEKLSALHKTKWQQMSLKAHQYAKSNLNLHKMVSDYESLFLNLIDN